MSHMEKRYSTKRFPSPRPIEVNGSLNWAVYKKHIQDFDFSE